MAEIILAIVLFLIAATAARMIIQYKNLRKSITISSTNDPMLFRCSAELVNEIKNDGQQIDFIISMRGKIQCPSQMHDTDVQILLGDVTSGLDKAQPVVCSVKQWQMEDSVAFYYRGHNGKIPHQSFVISQWHETLTIPVEVLTFPRQGQRKLEFVLSIISRQTDQELACANTIIDYYNDQPGYIDAKEHSRHRDILSAELAATIAGIDGHLQHEQVSTIKSWLEQRTQATQQQGRTDADTIETKLQDCAALPDDQALRKIESICTEIYNSASGPECYNVMKLCLETVGAVEQKPPDLLHRLKTGAEAMEIDCEKFRAMSQKFLPDMILESTDMEFVLGINPKMSRDELIDRLNDEYQKWNARVTHCDPSVRRQADKMLNMIAEARSTYIEQTC